MALTWSGWRDLNPRPLVPQKTQANVGLYRLVLARAKQYTLTWWFASSTVRMVLPNAIRCRAVFCIAQNECRMEGLFPVVAAAAVTGEVARLSRLLAGRTSRGKGSSGRQAASRRLERQSVFHNRHLRHRIGGVTLHEADPGDRGRNSDYQNDDDSSWPKVHDRGRIVPPPVTSYPSSSNTAATAAISAAVQTTSTPRAACLTSSRSPTPTARPRAPSTVGALGFRPARTSMARKLPESFRPEVCTVKVNSRQQ